MQPPIARPAILVDADACPVKDEIIRVAMRMDVPAVFVANAYLRLPRHKRVHMQVVSGDFDAADDWIADQADTGTLVVTADILLADRALKAGALVLGPAGVAFTGDNIGGAIAARAIKQDLRASLVAEGAATRNRPFTKADRSRFLQMMDRLMTQLIKTTGR